MIPDRIAAKRKDISFQVHPESQYKIEDQGGAHREERDVHKPGPNPAGRNAQTIADGRTDPEEVPFDKMPEPVHPSKLNFSGFFSKPCRIPFAIFNYLCRPKRFPGEEKNGLSLTR